MRRWVLFLAAVLVVSAGAPARAQEGPALTAAYLDGFIGAMPELEALGKELNLDEELVKPEIKPGGEIPTNPMTQAAAAIEKHEAAPRFRAIITKHGFPDIMTWGHVGDRILHAYVSVKLEQENPDMDAEMKKAMAEIDDSDMPAEQKEAMKKMMASQMKMVGSMAKAPQGDKDVVKSKLKELDAAFK